MRLVAWNCNMRAHDKLAALQTLRPDVAIVAECAGPEVRAAAPVYAAASSYAWTGEVATKGLAVLGFGAWAVCPAERLAGGRLALPVVVAGPTSFRLLALWPQSPKYVRESHAALDAHEAWLAEADAVVAGDLNSNTIWDRHHGARNHSALVARLAERGLVSAYHRHCGDAQGSETLATYYHYRHVHRPFHIDFMFIPEAWWPRVRSVEVGRPEDWLGLSDHVPVVVYVDL